MTFDHDFSCTFPIFPSLLKKKRKEEKQKSWSKILNFYLIKKKASLCLFPYVKFFIGTYSIFVFLNWFLRLFVLLLIPYIKLNLYWNEIYVEIFRRCVSYLLKFNQMCYNINPRIHIIWDIYLLWYIIL